VYISIPLERAIADAPIRFYNFAEFRSSRGSGGLKSRRAVPRISIYARESGYINRIERARARALSTREYISSQNAPSRNVGSLISCDDTSAMSHALGVFSALYF